MAPRAADKQAFVAGQVAVLEMEGCNPSYLAFASAPEDEEYEFLIKRSDQAANLAHILFKAEAVSEITLSNIVGNGFAVEKYQAHDLIFVAMGTGIAPLRSTLRHVFCARENYGKLIVLHGARTKDDFYFAEEIQNEWRNHDITLRQVISRPDEEWSGATGYVQGLLDHIVPDLIDPVALICGSQEMMQHTKERLHELGFSDEKILTNY